MSVHILSQALIELGEERIISMDQDTEPARVVADVYDLERDSLLEEHPWNFAIKRIFLAREEKAPAFGFKYSFCLPADCLFVVETRPVTSFLLEGGRLLTNKEAIGLRYVCRVENVSQMPPAFQVALATRIAAKVCKKLTGSSAEKERLEDLYLKRLRLAKSRDAQSGSTTQVTRPDSFIRVRQ